MNNIAVMVNNTIVETLVIKTLAMLSSVSSGMDQTTLKEYIKNKVNELTDIKFKGENEFYDISSRRLNIALKIMIDDESLDDDTVVKKTFETPCEMSDRMLNTASSGIANAMSKLIKIIRIDIPDKADALVDLYYTEFPKIEKQVDSRIRTPATLFTWGRLSDPAFVQRVKNTTNEICNFSSDKIYHYSDCYHIVKRFDNHIYAHSLILNDKEKNTFHAVKNVFIKALAGNTDEKYIYTEHDLDWLLDLVFNRADLFKYSDRLKLHLDGKSTNCNNIVSIVNKLSKLSKFLDDSDKIVSDLADGTHGEAVKVFFNNTTDVAIICEMALMACQILRATHCKNYFILTSPADMLSPEDRVLLSGDSIFVNSDTVEKYKLLCSKNNREVTDVLMDATILRHSLSVANNGELGNNLNCETAVNMIEGAYSSVDDHDRTNIAFENKVKLNATYAALSMVLKSEILQSESSALHSKATNIRQLTEYASDIARGQTAPLAAITDYLITINNQPSVTDLYYKTLDNLTNLISDENSNELNSNDLNIIRSTALSYAVVDFMILTLTKSIMV